MRTSLLLLAGLLAASIAPAMQAADEDGNVLYLTGLNKPPLKSTVLRDTQLNLTRASNTYMTYLPRGQVVEILAIARYQLQVRGKMRTGAVQGWVKRSDVADIPGEVISDIEDQLEAQRKLEDAIKRKEVIFGMTQEQVQMILGRPADKSSIQEEKSVTEVWTYYSYKSVPVMETFGFGTNAYTQVATQKVRTGAKVISFTDGKVVRIEQKTEQIAPQTTYPYPQTYPPMAPIVIPKGSSY